MKLKIAKVKLKLKKLEMASIAFHLFSRPNFWINTYLLWNHYKQEMHHPTIRGEN